MGPILAAAGVLISLTLAWVYGVVLRYRPGRKPVSDPPQAGVSLVVCVRNHSGPVIRHLPGWLSQDHTPLEIVIVDDHSVEAEFEELSLACRGEERIRLIRNDGPQGKKAALMQGIQQASYPVIVLTDSDCRPASSQWVRRMLQAGADTGLVLGCGPYEKGAGFLNRFQRFETLMTAVQYLGWAGAGVPYTGVGRNLAFPREWFMQAEPLKDTLAVPYGDDDVIVQSAASSIPVHACVDSSAFMFSDPSPDWTTWLRQKHRHLSAGHQYPLSARIPAMMVPLLLIGYWAMLPFMAMYAWSLAVCLISMVVRWYRGARWSRQLGDKDLGYSFPALELLYTLHLVLTGTWATLRPKKTWS